ncbi:MAG: (d)CMP kinase [Chloroflexota bacterium]
MPKPSTIAIDGPVAAGKSAVGALLALRLGYRFVDTGMMYRAITWAILRDKIDPDDEATVTALAQQTQIEVTGSDGLAGPRISVDGHDVTEQIRTREVEQGVSRISRFTGVRQAMVARQRVLAQQGMIIMAGRDIGTVVLLDADLKIFLTASAEERARRRYRDMQEAGQSPEFDQVLEDLLHRDKLDTERANSPLRPADGAHILNTNRIALAQVVDRILALAEDD